MAEKKRYSYIKFNELYYAPAIKLASLELKEIMSNLIKCSDELFQESVFYEHIKNCKSCVSSDFFYNKINLNFSHRM